MPAPFTLMKLPYADNALEPVISANTISFHHAKHHQTYITNLNKLVEGTPMAAMSLEEIVKSVAGDPAKAPIFNNAAQVWNHDFFWNSLTPNGGGKPTGKIGELIESSFGGYDKFKTDFAATTVGQFGSGWGWLCYEGGKLTIRKTGNAETPLTVAGVKPLLTIDVWEHAYYLDHQNRRPDFVGAVIDKLLNWKFAEANLG
jgi:superoxide dismutase, Fe-Mn family